MAQPTDSTPLPSEVSGADGRLNIFEMWMGPWSHLTRQSTIYPYKTPRLEARRPQAMEKYGSSASRLLGTLDDCLYLGFHV